jgi:crotonobetainyl-CoA:carnitine CoA-transferase CaiB-like acyl-CoA transferase
VGLLSSYRVLDLTDERGLLAGRMLADLGADVVQVEPLAGSRARHYVTLGSGRRAQTMPGRWATASIPAFELHRPAPQVGEHTDEVLAEWLGYDAPVREPLHEGRVIA